MSTGKKTAPGAVTRRALLVAGGVTLLVGYMRRPDQRMTGAAHPTPAPGRSPAPSPAASPAAGAAQPAGAPPSHVRLAGKEQSRNDPPGGDPARRRRPGPRPAGPRAPGRGRRGGAADGPMSHLDDGPKVIALTIDDGPSPVYTPQVLRLLDKYQVTATFSMIGLQVAAHPAMAREVAAAGH